MVSRLIIIASLTLKKVCECSKNAFASFLINYNMLLGVAYLGLALSEAFRREVELPEGVRCFLNFHALIILIYLLLIAARQGSILSIRYR